MIGPLYGAVVLAVADWRVIFAVNLVVGLVLAVLDPPGRPARARRPSGRATASTPATVDWVGLVLLAGRRWSPGALVFVEPGTSLVSDVTWGQLFIPVAGSTAAGSPRSGSSRSWPRCCSWSRCWHRPAPAGRPARLVGDASARPTCAGALSSWPSRSAA